MGFWVRLPVGSAPQDWSHLGAYGPLAGGIPAETEDTHEAAEEVPEGGNEELPAE